MRVDLHCHTHYSPDCWVSPRERVERAISVGLNALAITDHNTLDGASEAGQWAADRLRIIAGEEIATRQGELIGIFLKEPIPAGIDCREAAERIRGQGGLVYLPHPYVAVAWDRIRSKHWARIEDLVDIVEAVNARNFILLEDSAAWAYAARTGKAVAASSDAHAPGDLGGVYQEMEPFDGPSDFIEKLRRADIIIGRRARPFWTAITVVYLYPSLWHRRMRAKILGLPEVAPETPPGQ